MTEFADRDLPEVLRTLRTSPLFVVHLAVRQTIDVGRTPEANRRLGVVAGGVFHGERLSGVVLEGGNDWQGLRADGVLTLDVRLVLKTNDDALIAMRYHGLRHGPGHVLAKIDRGESVDPSTYYFRSVARFETAASKYDWLNRIFAVGLGHRLDDGPTYSLFEVL
jgi:Protein of unknown function (DUF3237)